METVPIETGFLFLESLLNSLWQSPLLVLLAAVLLRLTRHAGALQRFRLLGVLFLAVALLPVMGWLTRLASVANPAGQERPAAESESDAIEFAHEEVTGVLALSLSSLEPSEAADVELSVLVSDRLPASGPATQVDEQAAGIRLPREGWTWPAGVVWGSIVFFLLFRLFWSFAHIQRMKRIARPFPEKRRKLLEDLASGYGLNPRRLRFGVSDEIPTPLALGLTRPCILFPAALAANLSDADLKRVALHEIAHIVRRDDWTRLFQKITEALCFFQPAVFWLSHRLEEERELACDSWVVAQTGEARPYAACLTRLASFSGRSGRLTLAPGAAFSKSLLSRRIEMLTQSPVRPRRASSPIVQGAALLTVAAAMAMLLQAPRLVALAESESLPASEPQSTQNESKLQSAPPHGSSSLPPDEVVTALDSVPSSAARTPGRGDAAVAAAPNAGSYSTEAKPQEPSPQPEREPKEKLRLHESMKERLHKSWHETVDELRENPAFHWEFDLKHLEGFEDQLASVFAAVPSWEFRTGDSGALPEEELIGLLTNVVRTDPDMRVRREALLGLARIRSQAASQALLDLFLEAQDAETTQLILPQIIHLGVSDERVRERLSRMASSTTDRELQRQAILVLTRSAEGTDLLIALYDRSSDEETKRQVVLALSGGAHPQASEKLKQIAIHDPAPEMRRLAVRSLSGRRGAFDFKILSPAWVGAPEPPLPFEVLTPPEAPWRPRAPEVAPRPDAPQPPS